MKKFKPRLQQALVSGAGYGFGLLAGSIIIQLISSTIRPGRFLVGNQALLLVQGILLAFILAGLAGFLGGFLGGWTLPVVGQEKGRLGYAWQGGTTLGICYGILIFPLILIISLLSFYEISNIPFLVFCVVFSIVGLIFGLILGGFLGALTLRRIYGPASWGGALGFAAGGAALGYGLWRYLLTVSAGQLESGSFFWLLLGIFLFGALGGASLGVIYQRAGDKVSFDSFLIHRLTAKGWTRRIIILGAVFFVLALLIRPIMASVGDLLTPIDAQLSPIIDLQTTGTHWLDRSSIANSIDWNAAIAADGERRLALSWLDDNGVSIAFGEWSEKAQRTSWQPPILLGASLSAVINDIQMVLDDKGQAQIVWVETNELGGSDIVASRCKEEGCTDPVLISSAAAGCGAELGSNNLAPTLALDSDGTLMLVWENESGFLLFVTWQFDSGPPEFAAGCVSSPEAQNSHNPRVHADQNGTFVLLFASPEDEIRSLRYIGGEWDAKTSLLGNGQLPEIFIDRENEVHAAWCSESEVIYWNKDNSETVAPYSCKSRPALAQDDEGQVHVVWNADGAEDANGRLNNVPVLLESFSGPDGWTTPAIVSRTESGTQPALSMQDDGSLHMAWSNARELSYAAHLSYRCAEDLSDLGTIMNEIGTQVRYIPTGETLPYCQNQYDRLIFTPNPDPAFSEQTPRVNGAFDTVADLIREAEYEVLYSTMWYDQAVDADSPGSVIASAVADLYHTVRQNPEQYPRGMTVRILLDNPPEMARGEATGQLWSLIADLRHAGVEKMVDPDSGWRLEVADYEGNMPHSHVKTVIIDGKTAVAAGFNTTYNHFPADHPSGKGNDRFDLGLQITGPVAQSALRMFDDMWIGADQRECLSLDPPFGIPWQVTCFDKSAAGGHTPEVTKYYLPGGSGTAFSLYRSKVHDAADIQMVETLRAAQDSIDIIQVNFTLDLVCNLNILFSICPVDIAPDYMPALLEAAENGVKIRVIIKPSPFEGIENNVAFDALNKRLLEQGLESQIELRFYEKDMHPKAALIDEQMLIIGSQNYHYSAFGSGGGLNEFSFAIEDKQAVEDFSRAFDYMWGQGVKP